MILLIYAVVLFIYWFCPKYIQAIMLIANIFLPDFVPVIDEIIMVAGLLKPSGGKE